MYLVIHLTHFWGSLFVHVCAYLLICAYTCVCIFCGYKKSELTVFLVLSTLYKILKKIQHILDNMLCGGLVCEGDHRDMKSVLDLMEPEVKTVVSHCMSAGKEVFVIVRATSISNH